MSRAAGNLSADSGPPAVRLEKVKRPGGVLIEDWDEYAASRRAGHMSDADAEVARATAEELAATLRIRGEEWLTLGWDLLGLLA